MFTGRVLNVLKEDAVVLLMLLPPIAAVVRGGGNGRTVGWAVRRGEGACWVAVSGRENDPW